MITSPDARKAFDITAESDKTRERYGYTSLGQCALLARRLVEAGLAVRRHRQRQLGHALLAVPEPEGRSDSFRRSRVQRPGHRPGRARPAGPHARDHDGRDGPHAADQQPRRPRSLVDDAKRALGRRRREAGPGHRRDRQAAACYPTTEPYGVEDVHLHASSIRWASTPARPITRRSAARCRSSTAAA